MNKLSSQEEKELIVFIKEWLRSHGYSQKDLAEQLETKSSRTSEIIGKLKDLHKKGGIIHIAKNLINIEQHWINNKNNNNDNNNYLESSNDEHSYPKEKKKHGYNQLDFNYKLELDELIDKMEKDHKIN